MNENQFFKVIATPELVDLIAERVIEKQREVIDMRVKEHVQEQLSPTPSFTTEEVAKITKRSVATVTRHCRRGLLLGSKSGKAWLITPEALEKYKNKRIDE